MELCHDCQAAMLCAFSSARVGKTRWGYSVCQARASASLRARWSKCSDAPTLSRNSVTMVSLVFSICARSLRQDARHTWVRVGVLLCFGSVLLMLFIVI